MRWCFSAALIFCITTTALAEPPKAVIMGPTGGRPGDLIVLNAHESVGEFFAWHIATENGHEQIARFGREAVIPTHAGVYYVFMSCSNSEGIAFAKWRVEITPSNPTPPTPPPNPGPNPTPNPNPPSPPSPTPPNPAPGPEDGRFAVAVLSYSAAKAVGRPQEASALGAAFRTIAKTIRDDQPGILSIMGLVRRETAKAIPESSKGAWSGFNDVIQTKLKSLYSGGQLSSTKDFADCFDELAVGLEYAAK